MLSGQPADAPRDEPGLRALSGDFAVFLWHGLGSSRPDPITHTLPAISFFHSAGGPGPFLESLVYSCLSQGHCPNPCQQDLLWQLGLFELPDDRPPCPVGLGSAGTLARVYLEHLIAV